MKSIYGEIACGHPALDSSGHFCRYICHLFDVVDKTIVLHRKRREHFGLK